MPAVIPAVIVTGARQTGKSTLAHELIPGDRLYLSLDDLDVQDLSRRDPDALLEGHRHITLYEVQREPDLLNAVKRSALLIVAASPAGFCSQGPPTCS